MGCADFFLNFDCRFKRSETAVRAAGFGLVNNVSGKTP